MNDGHATIIAAVITGSLGLVATISAAIISSNVTASSWQVDYDALSAQYTSLQTNYNDLQKQYDDLLASIDDSEPGDDTQTQDNDGNAHGEEETSDTATNSSSNGILFISFKPVTNQSYYINEGELEDSLEYNYSNDTTFARISSYNGSAEYYINNQFSTLTGYIAAYTTMFDECSATITISVSTDGENYRNIFTRENITRTTERFSTGELNVSGYKFLKFESSGSGYWEAAYNYLLLTDFTLS
ncbi:MAG: hypothetical protein LUE11_08535 [Clostridia bacterium]|nr:hypothetical protein [Clostridia bacterium]